MLYQWSRITLSLSLLSFCSLFLSEASLRSNEASPDLHVRGHDLVTVTPALIEDLDGNVGFGGFAVDGDDCILQFIGIAVASIALETVDAFTGIKF